MKIDEKTLQQLEKLAKLSVEDKDRELTMEKIVGVLNMLDNIDMNDIADLEPLYHPLGIEQPLRNDEPNAEIPRDDIQQQSPQVERGLFLVPKVIE